MIATILPSSTNFHAVGYNENKVAKGQATLLEIKNFGGLENFERNTPEELTSYLCNYSSRNGRVRKPQFHVAISCKGKEMTQAQLLDFAHDYLKEMGYGNAGQPVLIYVHNDTANLHLHIVTSRIRPDGKKIDDHNERIKSQNIINKLIGNDVKAKTLQDIETAFGYKFSSITQFKSIMSALGYSTYDKDGSFSIKRSGKVQMKIKSEEILQKLQGKEREIKRVRQLKAILKKYRDISTDHASLQSELKRKFGIDLVFFGKKDTPYGYMLIDHKTKTVYNGNSILSIKALLDFTTPEEKLELIDSFLDRILSANPKADTFEINKKLRNSGAFIKRGKLYFHNNIKGLKPFMKNTILRNDKITRAETFKPASIIERDLLCEIYKINEPELIEVSEGNKSTLPYNELKREISQILLDETLNPKKEIKDRGYRIYQKEDKVCIIDFSRHLILDLKEEGIEISRINNYKKRNVRTDNRSLTPKASKKNPLHKIKGLRDAGGGSRDENREWEVGRNNDYDESEHYKNRY